ncbi:pyroglutamyl-peptidase I [Bdellovibrio bacteriovorus]|uniref:pyroglutamyl-peptidase I n=1 Tax=Bdellovibrio bacteriovorus TaxID=959 RepID=UPI0021CE6A9D|nr:pyroglutamyl-peptidase I [Bdellovibrio bacteriovorus]UXR63736.1 pyroglutamyl-peptidase I [Bdellovibrio bacteriovorus]
MKHKKVLITGFLPFLGESLNPSQILLENIKRDLSLQDQIDTLLLPVSFQQAGALLLQQLKQGRYDVVLMLGQAGGRKRISLEQVALNWIETEKPDEDGFTPQRGPIASQSESAYFTALPLPQWQKLLEDQQIPAEISLSAGGYVCNHIYFQVSAAIHQQGLATQACFIHVPYLPEQTVGKATGTPAMELDQMEKGIRLVLKAAINKPISK